MAWALSCSCTTGMMMATTFGRCAPTGVRLTSPTTQHLRPSRAPTSWTSWSTTTTVGGDRALVSTTTRRRTAPPACKKRGQSGQGPTSEKELEFEFDVSLTAEDDDHFPRNFVQRMREMLRDEGNRFVVHDIARLPQPVGENETPELMNLTLLAGGANVTLSVRTDNLYVVGFRSGHNDGTWFEFRHDRPRPHPMIDGSTYLPFTGSYAGTDGIGDLSEPDHDIFDRQTVEGAIWGLARYDGRHDDRVKRWLRTLIVNFIESVRFNAIAQRAASQMRRNPSGDRRLTAPDIEWIHNWGNMSLAVMRVVNDPTVRFQPWFLERRIHDAINVSQVLGMALLTREFSACNQRRRRAVDDDSGAIVGGGGGGLTLAEVVGVVIGNINECDPGKLYGTITLTDGLGTFPLYNRDKDHYQEVGPRGKADLGYAPRPISSADDFTIDVDLMDHYSWIRSDRKVAVGQVAWNSGNSGDYYNRILTRNVAGEHGDVDVHYAVLTDAVVAKVEVMMEDSGNSIFNPNVYGSVTATTSMASGDPLQYSLFDKPQKENHKVRHQESVPLQRNLVSAPLCSMLKVHANLWDYNEYEFSDDLIVDGSVVFIPRLDGIISKAEIRGPRGTVRVEVTWSNSLSHE